MDEKRYRRVLARMLDENEFLSPYGIRSLSRYHLDHPYVFTAGGQEFKVQYAPAESDTSTFGGNSNWRGPIWIPVNLLIIRSLLSLYQYYGDDFQDRVSDGFRQADDAVRGQPGDRKPFDSDIPARPRRDDGLCMAAPKSFRPIRTGKDLIMFFEYFHGDNGAGIGASHQTGWTGTVASLIQMFAVTTSGDILANDFSKLVYSEDRDLELAK